MKKISNHGKILFLAACFSLSTGCSPSGNVGEMGRLTDLHASLTIEDPALSGANVSSKVGSMAESVSAQSISVGSIYLESQLAPLTVAGHALQATDVSVSNGIPYVSYGYLDTTGAIRAGAIESVKPNVCGFILYTQYCLNLGDNVNFTNANIYSTFVSGTNIFAVGTTSDTSTAPYYGRLFKVGLDAGANPSVIQSTLTLPSFTGTQITGNATNLFVTYGTSPTAPLMGGLGIFRQSDLGTIATQPLYDARSVAVEKGDPTKVLVTRGAISSSNQGALVEYNADGTGTALRTIANGGNNIAESKSDVSVGTNTILESLGDGGFKVLCRTSGATLASVAAVTVSGIAAAKTVTNSVTAAPGYIFAANGEAGVYVYKFERTNALVSNPCSSGVTLTLVGRLKLDTDNSDLTYVNAELSANSVKYVPILNLLNVVTARLVVVASGNKGISLLNITNITLTTSAIDDY